MAISKMSPGCNKGVGCDCGTLCLFLDDRSQSDMSLWTTDSGSASRSGNQFTLNGTIHPAFYDVHGAGGGATVFDFNGSFTIFGNWTAPEDAPKWKLIFTADKIEFNDISTGSVDATKTKVFAFDTPCGAVFTDYGAAVDDFHTCRIEPSLDGTGLIVIIDENPITVFRDGPAGCAVASSSGIYIQSSGATFRNWTIQGMGAGTPPACNYLTPTWPCDPFESLPDSITLDVDLGALISAISPSDWGVSSQATAVAAFDISSLVLKKQTSCGVGFDYPTWTPPCPSDQGLFSPVGVQIINFTLIRYVDLWVLDIQVIISPLPNNYYLHATFLSCPTPISMTTGISLSPVQPSGNGGYPTPQFNLFQLGSFNDWNALLNSYPNGLVQSLSSYSTYSTPALTSAAISFGGDLPEDCTNDYAAANVTNCCTGETKLVDPSNIPRADVNADGTVSSTTVFPADGACWQITDYERTPTKPFKFTNVGSLVADCATCNESLNCGCDDPIDHVTIVDTPELHLQGKFGRLAFDCTITLPSTTLDIDAGKISFCAPCCSDLADEDGNPVGSIHSGVTQSPGSGCLDPDVPTLFRWFIDHDANTLTVNQYVFGDFGTDFRGETLFFLQWVGDLPEGYCDGDDVVCTLQNGGVPGGSTVKDASDVDVYLTLAQIPNPASAAYTITCNVITGTPCAA